jgi:hypothetical protein
MRGTRSRSLAAGTIAATAMLAGAVALAPGAGAVAPTTATATYNCGIWGTGATTLTVVQNGTAATVQVTSSAFTAPLDIAANSITSTLKLTLNGGSTQTTFTGTINPAVATGSPVTVGPLPGTVASGDSLDSFTAGTAYSLRIVIFGVTVDCKATTAQTPGPFVFS